MAKKKKTEKKKEPVLPGRTKRVIAGMGFVLLSIVTALGFIDKAGKGGEVLSFIFKDFLMGRASLLLPVVFFLCALVFFRTHQKRFVLPLFISVIVFVTGFTAILGQFDTGGWWGGFVYSPVESILGSITANIVFIFVSFAGVFIFLNLLYEDFSLYSFIKDLFAKEEYSDPSIMRKIFVAPSFETKKKKEEAEEDPIPVKNVSQPKKENFPGLIPPFDLLSMGDEEPDPGDTKRNSSIIKKTLGDFDIPVSMGEINVGPAVTQYTLKPAEGIKLTKITSLSDDLALALAMHPVRTEAPIPGKSLVGIEVPNRKRAQITLGGLIKAKKFENSSPLTFVVGKDVSGYPVYTDLSKMPHLLVSGSTGSGKTIFLNTLILSLIYKNSPQDLRVVMVDPKRVEFSLYAHLPHLLTPVIYDASKASNAMEWLVGEMERRFKVLAEAGKRDINGYRELKDKNLENMPYIMLIVDELADLMASKGNEIEGYIVRVAQMARAVGIHLVLATQRPSVEVITGLIKANITARISFRVASQIDSRTVLDMGGAEKLLGSGDMLLLSAENAKPRRVQAPYISEKEIKNVLNWLKENTPSDEDDSLAENIEQSLEHAEEKDMYAGEEGDDDPLYDEARKLVIESKKASASFLQRRLRIGYVRSARLIDILERRGVVGPAEGAKPRDIYVENNDDDIWDKV